ncbi:MAG: serpin family protein [Deltaproteobacteria bacterium]|jgi:serpin B|nr:serpin family protein [Deltaproteobacteria bacterium]
MLKTLFLIALFVIFCLGATGAKAADAPKATGTSAEPSQPGAPVEPTLPEAELLALAAGDTAFALDLYAKLKDSDGNLFFSPASVSAVFALLREGAKGETLSQIDKILRFPASEKGLSLAQRMNELNQYLEKAGQSLKDDPKKTPKPNELSLANSLWPKEGLTILPDYLKALGEDPNIYPVDYQKDSAGAVKKINGWVLEKTKDKIKDLLSSPLPKDTSLVLVNAVYFLGKWTHPFDPAQTKPRDFTLASGEKVNVPFVNQKRAFAYLATNEGQILELPYGDKKLSLLAFLPKEGADGLAALEKALTPENLANWREGLKNHQVIVSLPKFEMVWGTNSLRKPLEDLGLTTPFKPTADFSGITVDEKILVSDILHKAFVSLDEEGTEAAAASAAIMVRAARIEEPAVFTADRPFIFLIQEKATGSILFLGRLANPKPGEPAK